MVAGRVGRAHGLDGSFYVTGSRPRLLVPGTLVRIAGRDTAIVRRAGTDERPIVRLEGIDDRAGAEALRGGELTVQREHAPALEDGEWWAGELEGCQVIDGERTVGVVSRLVELPSCEALEVRTQPSGTPRSGKPAGTGPQDGDAGQAILIPMVRDAIRHVDTAKRRIEVDMSFLEDV